MKVQPSPSAADISLVRHSVVLDMKSLISSHFVDGFSFCYFSYKQIYLFFLNGRTVVTVSPVLVLTAYSVHVRFIGERGNMLES